MERTKPASSNTKVKYKAQDEPIVLSKGLLDVLLKDIRPSEVISLYCFYYYTAKWQKTNQIKAVTNYVARGLQWSEDKVRAVKKRLQDLGLIENVIEKNMLSSKIQGHYIKVNFIWGIGHPPQKPECGSDPSMEINRTNALSTNIISCESDCLNEFITPKLFEQFWLRYPKKTDKGKALTAWNKLCAKKDRPLWTDIKRALRLQKETERWKDGYIPLPTTWINNNRWLDDPKEMKSSFQENSRQKAIVYDGIKYTLGPDGKYRSASGEIYID